MANTKDLIDQSITPLIALITYLAHDDKVDFGESSVVNFFSIVSKIDLASALSREENCGL